jgi:excisionase family DNA binding protein
VSESDRTAPLHLLSTSEAAGRLGVAAQTVALWARSGRLPLYGTTGSQGDRLFDPNVIDRIARERRALRHREMVA